MPALKSATDFGLSAMALSAIASSASASLTCAIPFSATMAFGSPPFSKTIANTSLAVGTLMAFASTRPMIAARPSGVIFTSRISMSRADNCSIMVVMTQLDAAFAFFAILAVCSK